jgi:LPS export ABC transporter protein LptC
MLSLRPLRTQHLLMLLLILAVGGSWYLIPDPLPSPREPSRQSDYYFVEFDRKQMDQQGKISSVFRAERIDHYPADKMSELVQPRAITYSPAQPPWFIRADSATQWEAENQLTLRGDVVANQRYQGENRFTLIESEQLQMIMEKKLLTTRRPITFTTEHSSSTATGANASLDSGRIILLKNAASHFDP